MAENTWKKTTVWPPSGTAMQRFFLAEDNALSTTAPTNSNGADTYKIDFDATTGRQNRWFTQLGGNDVVYPDRTTQDARLLTYMTPPLAADMEVTGSAVITLQVSSTSTDGNFFVYLEDVGPDGRVTYVTEGMLRALHRKISTDEPPYKTLYPYHSFKKKDAQPLQPGQRTTLAFHLLPTSVLFKAGHRIRIAISGADKDTFLRIPLQGEPTITVSRTQREPSFIDLPVVPR
jgi:putative CocE/NonD family hydrolase